MSENITVARVIPARAERIFNAWLSADEHGKMTGAAATAEADGQFTAYDGYIRGRTLEQVPNERIVQTWRTTEFPDHAPDSTLTITFTPVEGGTQVSLEHVNIPQGQGASYERGWVDHYFEPMTRYFTSAGSRVREVGEVLEGALETAEHQVGEVAQNAAKAVEKARVQAQKQAKKAVKAVKKVQKKALARAKAVTKKVKALVKKRKPAPKKPAKAKAAKKPSKKQTKKASPKKKAKR